MARLRIQARRASDPMRVPADVLVVPLREGAADGALVRALDRATGRSLRAHVRDAGFRGQEGRGLFHRLSAAGRFRSVYLAGLGTEPVLETWRRSIASAANAARAEGAASLTVFFTSGGADEAVAAAEGTLLSAYRFQRYRQPPKEKRPELTRVTLAGPEIQTAGVQRELARLRIVTDAVAVARDLVNEPPSIKTASVLAKRAVDLCRGTATRVEVMGLGKIRALGLNGLLAVNRGSVEEPRFVRLTYRPRRRSKLRVALVGKGITFDSGGLSLKPAGAMETMKQDMAGAAAVFATMAAIGRLKPSVAVTGYVPSTDNLPSGSAQKPGDIIRYRNGKTVEVLNTDAEGRLILADALALASEEKADVVIDLATLTGACRVALGTQVAGIMGNRRELVDRLVEHGREAGEQLWPLPLVKEYRDELKSQVADLKNVGSGFAGAITAGLFLQEFVAERVAWAHLDIAGPAWADKDSPYCSRGGTGFGVRTLVRYLMQL